MGRLSCRTAVVMSLFAVLVVLLAPCVPVCAAPAASVKPLDHALDAQLSAAVSAGQTAQARALLARGADPNFKAPHQAATPLLCLAAASGSTEIVRALIGGGADVNARANDGRTPLLFNATKTLAGSGNLEIARLLVAAGADVSVKTADGKSAIDLAWASGLNEVAKYLQTVRDRDETLLQAAAQHDWSKIKVALTAGANPRYQTAIVQDEDDEEGDTATAAMLLKSTTPGFDEAVADQIINRSNLEVADKDGETALLLAVIGRDLSLSRLLVKAGANPNVAQTATGDTALIVAAQYNTLDMVKLLVEAGAKLDVKNKAGQTALDVALYKDVKQYLAAPAAAAAENLPDLADLAK